VGTDRIHGKQRLWVRRIANHSGGEGFIPDKTSGVEFGHTTDRRKAISTRCGIHGFCAITRLAIRLATRLATRLSGIGRNILLRLTGGEHDGQGRGEESDANPVQEITTFHSNSSE
jgi:hypothetical protein